MLTGTVLLTSAEPREEILTSRALSVAAEATLFAMKVAFCRIAVTMSELVSVRI